MGGWRRGWRLCSSCVVCRSCLNCCGICGSYHLCSPSHHLRRPSADLCRSNHLCSTSADLCCSNHLCSTSADLCCSNHLRCPSEHLCCPGDLWRSIGYPTGRCKHWWRNSHWCRPQLRWRSRRLAGLACLSKQALYNASAVTPVLHIAVMLAC